MWRCCTSLTLGGEEISLLVPQATAQNTKLGARACLPVVSLSQQVPDMVLELGPCKPSMEGSAACFKVLGSHCNPDILVGTNRGRTLGF